RVGGTVPPGRGGRLDALGAARGARAPRGRLLGADPRERVARRGRKERVVNFASPRSVLTVAGRELRGYFATPLGHVFILFYVLVSNGFFFFIHDFFRVGQATMRGFFGTLPWIFLFF